MQRFVRNFGLKSKFWGFFGGLVLPVMRMADLTCFPFFLPIIAFRSPAPSLVQRSIHAVSDNGSTDGSFEGDRIPKAAGDPSRREFTYFMLGGARFIYASAVRLAVIKVSFLTAAFIFFFMNKLILLILNFLCYSSLVL